ncbi:hypothetical protein PS1_018958 [Malus domestica]
MITFARSIEQPMARPQLLHTFLVADLKEAPKLIYGQAKIKEPAQVRESHHRTNCIWGTLSISAFHGADHILEKMRYGKSKSQHKVVQMEFDDPFPSSGTLAPWFMAAVIFHSLVVNPLTESHACMP